jgi:GntR family transcriptional regulator/MocR family aminotransferase
MTATLSQSGPVTRSTQPPKKGTNLGLRLELGELRARGPKAVADSVADALRHVVRSGRLPASSALPASRTLAADLGVSRGVVVRAYEQLVAEGYLQAHVGRGTTVNPVRPESVPATAPTNRSFIPSNPGVPALAWFPRAEWLRAMETAMRELPTADLGYGDPRGHPRLRRALAEYLGRTRAVVAPPDRVVVTGGFAQGSRLVAEALVRQGFPVIGVEEPGSRGLVETLRAGGLETLPVRVDEHALDVEALAATPARAVAVTPAHQFPTGAVLAPQRRTELLEWASVTAGVVFEDDYDAEYRYDRAPVGALQGLAPDRVVYGGSVSKTLAPALRLGWLVAPGWLIDALAEVKHWADIATPVLDQVALAVFLESGGLDRHIRRTAGHYATRRLRLLAAVEQHLPGWTVTGIAAGLHAVLVPAEPLPASAYEQMAGRCTELDVVPLAAYASAPAGQEGLVVGYGTATPDAIERGVQALAG